jgi:hypothetical protein
MPVEAMHEVRRRASSCRSDPEETARAASSAETDPHMLAGSSRAARDAGDSASITISLNGVAESLADVTGRKSARCSAAQPSRCFSERQAAVTAAGREGTAAMTCATDGAVRHVAQRRVQTADVCVRAENAPRDDQARRRLIRLSQPARCTTRSMCRSPRMIWALLNCDSASQSWSKTYVALPYSRLSRM